MAQTPTEWFCDVCDGLITDPKPGLVLNRSRMVDGGYEDYDFILVHKTMSNEGVVGCDPGNQAGYRSSMDIADYIGVDGMAHLLAMLSPGPLKPKSDRPSHIGDYDSFVDVFRRLHVPGYEQARRYFTAPDIQDNYSDSNEVYPYLQDSLEAINQWGSRQAEA